MVTSKGRVIGCRSSSTIRPWITNNGVLVWDKIVGAVPNSVLSVSDQLIPPIRTWLSPLAMTMKDCPPVIGISPSSPATETTLKRPWSGTMIAVALFLIPSKANRSLTRLTRSFFNGIPTWFNPLLSWIEAIPWFPKDLPRNSSTTGSFITVMIPVSSLITRSALLSRLNSFK